MGNDKHMSEMLTARATTGSKLIGGDEFRHYIIRVAGAGFIPAHILYPPTSSIALEAEMNSATT
jgi:hypothetical protein